MSLHARRLIDLLELEHLAHAGSENGFLKLTYRQMQAAGISGDFIAATITELETLGLLTVTHKGSYRGGAKQNPSTYKLNYLPWRFQPGIGGGYYLAPTDEWQTYQGKTARPKSVRMHHTGGAFSTTRVVQTVEGSNEANQGKPTPFDKSRMHHMVVAPYILAPSTADVPMNTVGFRANAKLIRASSPFPLSASQDKRGFVLTVVASPAPIT
jgi:hypothetical protein